jgi:ABC-type uncharacterized transport system substrate-binding protein
LSLSRLKIPLIAVLAGAILMVLAPPAVQAHPHVWVSVRSQYVFDAGGKIAGIRHSWTFDEMYSAFALQGLGKDGVPVETGLKALAKVNVTQLAEYGYFTLLRVGGRKIAFSGAKDQMITLDDKRNATLHFTLVLKQPIAAKPAAMLKVVDPSYYVAFDFAKKEPVTLTNAPKGCSISMVVPQPLTAAQRMRLEAVAGTNDSPGTDFGILLASSAIAACP